MKCVSIWYEFFKDVFFIDIIKDVGVDGINMVVFICSKVVVYVCLF